MSGPRARLPVPWLCLRTIVGNRWCARQPSRHTHRHSTGVQDTRPPVSPRCCCPAGVQSRLSREGSAAAAGCVRCSSWARAVTWELWRRCRRSGGRWGGLPAASARTGECGRRIPCLAIKVSVRAIDFVWGFLVGWVVRAEPGRRRRKKKDTAWRIFSLKELQSATNNFNYDNKLGEGGFGSVYWGQLWDGSQVRCGLFSSISVFRSVPVSQGTIPSC